MKKIEMKHSDGLLWPDVIQPGRRRFLGSAAACLALGSAGPAAAHGIGIVRPPLALPTTMPVTCSDGRRVPLGQLLMRQTTAMQLMFTGCSETCPLQGALFASLHERLVKPSGAVRLLSLSIDPMDDARSLSAWLQRFGAGANWRAAVPAAAQDLDRLREVLQLGASTKRAHSAQVYFVDRHAQLVWRSEDFPPTEVVLAIAQQLLRQSD